MSHRDILDISDGIMEVIEEITKNQNNIREDDMPNDEHIYKKRDHDAETADDLDPEEVKEKDEDTELTESKMSRDARILIHHIENDREIYKKYWEKLQKKVSRSGKVDLRKLKDDLQKIVIVALTDYNDKMKDQDDIDPNRKDIEFVVDYLSDSLEQMASINENLELPEDEAPICVDILKDTSRVGEGYRLLVSFTYSKPVLIPSVDIPAVAHPSQLLMLVPSNIYDMALKTIIEYQQSILPPADGEDVFSDPDADPNDSENIEFIDTSVIDTGSDE